MESCQNLLVGWRGTLEEEGRKDPGGFDLSHWKDNIARRNGLGKRRGAPFWPR